MFQTGDYAENLQATPIVVDGVMYLITARARVFALDAATGREIWHYQYPEPPRSVPGFVGNRGLAVGDGKVFFGTKDNYMVALDQKTGRLVWRVNVDDARQCGCNITAAPLVVKDKVIVGGTGGDGAHRGYLTAFYTKNGRLAWRWYVIPGPGEKGHETWKGDSWKFGGGAPWLTGSFDPALNLVYWGTGNAAADFYDADRVAAGADKSKDVNLYTASVVALDADTGKLRWHYQEVPDDLWDYDSAYEVLLMDREIRGRMRQMLVHMNKSGLTSVLDRVTGEFLGAFSVPEVRTGSLASPKTASWWAATSRSSARPPPSARARPARKAGTPWRIRRAPVFSTCPSTNSATTLPRTTIAARGRAELHEWRFPDEAGRRTHHLQPRGCLGSGDRQTRLEHAV